MSGLWIVCQSSGSPWLGSPWSSSPLTDALLPAALLIASVWSALVGGILYAFSTFVMPGLARQVPSAGVAAMQSVNETVYTPWVMVPFLGNGVLGAGLVVGSFFLPGVPPP
ncbi:MAG: hypothetical protein AAFU79_36615, partial [Myxococcota bacterium]